MIAQTMAVAATAARVRSLTSIMSTLGKRTVGWQHPALFPMLVAPRGAPAGRPTSPPPRRRGRLIGSPAYPQDHDRVRERAEETFDRGVSASGVMRQMLAILNQPDRSRALAALRIPAAVVHGSADKMVHVSGGRATARVIPGAELLVSTGWATTSRPSCSRPDRIIRRTADRAAGAASDGPPDLT